MEVLFEKYYTATCQSVVTFVFDLLMVSFQVARRSKMCQTFCNYIFLVLRRSQLQGFLQKPNIRLFWKRIKGIYNLDNVIDNSVSQMTPLSTRSQNLVVFWRATGGKYLQWTQTARRVPPPSTPSCIRYDQVVISSVDLFRYIVLFLHVHTMYAFSFWRGVMTKYKPSSTPTGGVGLWSRCSLWRRSWWLLWCLLGDWRKR